MGIGYRIKEARERLGLTQTELGSMVGVTGSAITNYEKETSHPKEQVIYRLMETLNVDANYLFQDAVKMKSQQNDVTLAEYDIVKKYRALDEHGRENVDCILENEYKRCTRIDSRQLSIFDLVGSEDIAELKKVTQLPDVHFSEEFDKLFSQLSSKKDTIPFRMEPSYDIVNAAHARTDISITDEDVQNDKDIMDDENF